MEKKNSESLNQLIYYHLYLALILSNDIFSNDLDN